MYGPIAPPGSVDMKLMVHRCETSLTVGRPPVLTTGTPAAVAIGTTAWMVGVATMPAMASTWSCSIIFLATGTAAAPPLASSPTSSLTVWPPSLLPWASRYSWNPFRWSGPSALLLPVSAVIRPMVMGESPLAALLLEVLLLHPAAASAVTAPTATRRAGAPELGTRTTLSP